MMTEPTPEQTRPPEPDGPAPTTTALPVMSDATTEDTQPTPTSTGPATSPAATPAAADPTAAPATAPASTVDPRPLSAEPPTTPVVAATSTTEQRPVRRPLGALPAVVPGIILSVVAIGLGVVAVHDALVLWSRSGRWDPLDLTGPTWVGASVDWVGEQTPKLWMSFAACGIVLVGLWLVILAVKPRRIRGAQIASLTGMWIEDSGVSRLAAAAAQQVAGVDNVRASASRRSVSLKVRAARSADSQALATEVRDAVSHQLRPLARTPKISVSVTQPDEPKPGSPA